jgi:hypothetical protein
VRGHEAEVRGLLGLLGPLSREGLLIREGLLSPVSPCLALCLRGGGWTWTDKYQDPGERRSNQCRCCLSRRISELYGMEGREGRGELASAEELGELAGSAVVLHQV